MASHLYELKHGTNRLMKILAMLGAATMVIFLTACGGGNANSGTSTTNHTLTIGASPQGPWSEGFNPFLSNGSSGNLYGTDGLLYETLYYWDQLDPSQTTPLLAQSYTLSPDTTQVTFHLQSGVKWSDGQAFTSADVVFTINYILQYKSLGIDGNGLAGFVKSATAPDANTVIVTFKGPSATNLWYLAGQTYIVPQHIWQSITNPNKYINSSPVGTGPFTLKSFASAIYKLKKNTSYWQASKVQVDEVDYPAFDSNTTGSALLANNTLDWTGLFIKDVKDVYVNRNPGKNVFYSPGIQTTMLVPNLKNPQLADLQVRKAISAAIDRSQLNVVAEDGDQSVASPTGLVLPAFKANLNASYPATFAGPNATTAKGILQADGYSLDSSGYFAKAGKELDFSIMAPNGWSDWNSIESLISTQLKSAGIKITVEEPAQPDWTTKVNNGNFDLTLHWTNHGPAAYYMYWALLDSSNTAAIGQPANSNYERWSDAKTDQDLATIAGTTDTTAVQNALNDLQSIMVNQLPTIPLIVGSDWNEYTTTRWTGWSSASNPYALPAPFDAPDVEITVLHLTPAN